MTGKTPNQATPTRRPRDTKKKERPGKKISPGTPAFCLHSQRLMGMIMEKKRNDTGENEETLRGQR